MAAQGGHPQRQDGAAGVRTEAGREAEALVSEGRGANYLADQRAKRDLARINRELKRLIAQMAEFEKRKSELIARTGK